MFYIKHFLQIIKNVKVNGLLFIFFTALLITSFHHRPKLKKMLSMSSKVISRPYFNALITDKINLSSISRKMKNLPGVEKVTIKKTMDVGRELKILSSELGDDFVKGLADLNYASLTIELTNGLQKRSQSLIREYLTRLVGKTSVAISDIKKPQKLALKKNDPYLVINNWGDWYILGIIFSFWFVSCLSLIRYLKNYSYLIEKFQRKKQVATKTYMLGFLNICFITYALNIYNNPKFVWEAAVVVCIMLTFSWGLLYKKQGFKKLI